ncbi:arginine deiminase family protein, partial [uncultured Corynebacterium sp.]|uniref:arginine deiminase family protein n=1 Tax=uncultured Corynebacterium sp. TaxID=159447 RepID=UPI00280450B3
MATPPLGVWSEVGKLHQVMVCAPGLAHERLTPRNCAELLFDDVLWVDEAKKHHAEFVTKLRSYGVEVLEMHTLLEETLATPGGRDFILDYKLLDKNVGAGIGGALRHWFNEMPTARL